MRNLCLALAALFLATTAEATCGPEPLPCRLGSGEYHLALPDGGGSNIPVVMFLHGAGSNGENVMRNSGLVKRLLSRGYAVVAPTGARQFGAGTGRSWNFFPGWSGRDETAFLKTVASDAAARFGLSQSRILLAGFSAGGFMVNYLACKSPETFMAYAPVAGGFWRPHPKTCAGPVKLFHTHGWMDKTVPIEGRYLRNGQFQQGDIFAGMEIWRAANLCPDEKPSNYSETGAFWRRAWTNCAANSALEFALFPGGHGVPPGWADMVLDWFETAVTN